MTYRIFICAFLILLFSSCATHYGTLNNAQVPSSKSQITYKEKVYGYSSCHYILGVGGMGSQGLAAEALFALRNSVELNNGEYLDNFTIDHKRFYFIPFYVRHEVLVSADKILSSEIGSIQVDSLYERQIRSALKNSNSHFNLNERVLIRNKSNKYNFLEATIVTQNNASVKVLLTDNSNKLKVVKLKHSDIFKIDAENNVNFFLSAEYRDTLRVKLNDFTEYGSFIYLGSNKSKILLQGLSTSKTYIFDKRDVIIDNNIDSNKSELNSIMKSVLNSTNPNQVLIARKENGELIKRIAKKPIGNNVQLVSDNNEELSFNISNIYTTVNWLEFGLGRTDGSKLEINEEVKYYSSDHEKGKMVKIEGFRYHSVLIRTESGKLMDVPIGKLF